MSSWKPGHNDISSLIDRGHLERISGQAADGTNLITQAHQRLAGARAALSADSIGAFELAYDGTRLAATALLVQQGLRPKSAAQSPTRSHRMLISEGFAEHHVRGVVDTDDVGHPRERLLRPTSVADRQIVHQPHTPTPKTSCIKAEMTHRQLDDRLVGLRCCGAQIAVASLQLTERFSGRDKTPAGVTATASGPARLMTGFAHFLPPLL